MRVPEFEVSVAEAAVLQAKGRAMTRAYLGSPVSRRWQTGQRQLGQALISEHTLGPSD